MLASSDAPHPQTRQPVSLLQFVARGDLPRGDVVRFPLSLRNVEDLLFERGIDSATRWCGSGGTGLVRCSRVKSAASGSMQLRRPETSSH